MYQFPETLAQVESQNLKYINAFIYLGSRVNSSYIFAEIANRIAKVIVTFGKLHHALRN